MIKGLVTPVYHVIIILSVIILVSNCKKDNSPPDVPILLSPENGLLGTFSDTLKWSCSDPDGDKLVYDIYFSKSNPPTKIRPDYQSNFLVLNDLDLNDTYYFFLIAKDPDGATSKSTVSTLKVIYDLPVLTTANSNGASVNSAISGGNIISQGNIVITSKGVCWSTEHNPTLEDNKTNDGKGMDNFVSLITGLNPTSIYYVRAYATNACGTSYGDELIIKTLSGTVSDIDGNIYNTIIIGNREWMVENLKVTKYRNGDPIPKVSDDSEWAALTSDAYCNMNNDENFTVKFGRLYNWLAVSDSRNIAPAGWHVASFEEWTNLTEYLGGELVAGDKLKEQGTTSWTSPNPGATNESGFRALPAGFRYDFGTYSPNLGNHGGWWSSSENSPVYAYAYGLMYDDGATNLYFVFKNYGYSVRCVKDY
jgi:uncharacterized protein (TIGR02145 family)